MLEIHCSGTPYEIGHKHGSQAKELVQRSIGLYAGLFQETAKLAWPKVQQIALEFEPVIREKWPAYLQEMQGLADGAEKTLADIIALNVRTEINFGLFSDGCTALSWRTETSSFLAQNWDWMEQQQENLVAVTIEQEGKPTIKMITEAGIIGKIGFNSAGVGVLLNAIRAKGMDRTRMPCHLGLRMVLESTTRDAAVEQIKKYGVASSCHMLIADSTGGVGVECSYIDVVKLPMNGKGQVLHTNHFLVEHPGIVDTVWLEDSRDRIKKIEQLCDSLGSSPGMQTIQSLFTDESNYPFSICRAQENGNHSATLFNIVMDLEAKKAGVLVGRPTCPKEAFDLVF